MGYFKRILLENVNCMVVPIPLSPSFIEKTIKQKRKISTQVIISEEHIIIKGNVNFKSGRYKRALPFSITLKPIDVLEEVVALKIIQMKPINFQPINQKIFNKPPFLTYYEGSILLNASASIIAKDLPNLKLKRLKIKKGRLWLYVGCEIKIPGINS